MERKAGLKRCTPITSKTRIQIAGKSDTAQLKEAIQIELRRIVVARDGDCILRNIIGFLSDFTRAKRKLPRLLAEIIQPHRDQRQMQNHKIVLCKSHQQTAT
jgi:hypothetical protein